MIYKYIITGKVHNSDRVITRSETFPRGLPLNDVYKRIDAFSKAFDFINFEMKGLYNG